MLLPCSLVLPNKFSSRRAKELELTGTLKHDLGCQMNTNVNETRVAWAGAILLAMLAGYLDGYGLLFLGIYVSFMSGNTTMTGVKTGQGNFHAAFASAVAILFFVVGSFLGNLLCQSRLRHAHRITFALIAGLIATVASLEWNGLARVPCEIAALSLSMGMLNPVLARVGAESVSLTFVTGTLSRIGGHLASAAGRKPMEGPQGPVDSHLARARVETGIWTGFLTGAMLAGLTGSHVRTWALLPPCLAMIALALFSESVKSENTVFTAGGRN